MRPRIVRELQLLREVWPDIDHCEAAGTDWFKIPNYIFPGGWSLKGAEFDNAPILFNAGPAYPAGDPYAFWGPSELTVRGAVPNNTTLVSNDAFGGNWLQFSWAPDGDWRPADPAEAGSNLRDWARSFFQRLQEGS